MLLREEPPSKEGVDAQLRASLSSSQEHDRVPRALLRAENRTVELGFSVEMGFERKDEIRLSRYS